VNFVLSESLNIDLYWCLEEYWSAKS